MPNAAATGARMGAIRMMVTIASSKVPTMNSMMFTNSMKTMGLDENSEIARPRF